MADNELLKQINRELHVTSLENSEKAKKSKLKSEEDGKIKEDTEEKEEDVLEEKEDDNELSDKEVEELNTLTDVASEQTEEVVNDLEANILSSDPTLLDTSSVVGTNEIDNVADKSGVLNDLKNDKTSSFVDPDSDDGNGGFKVVDTVLGVFTILNSDDKHVLLLDSNKQKIQISLEDFNNLNPFEVRDERLSSVNDFKDAYERDLKEKEEIEKRSAENAEEGGSEESDEFSDEGFENESEDEFDIGFGESVDRRKEKKVKQEKKNVLDMIQKNLASKQGVSETIRTDVRSKNRCVLAANKAKLSKEKEKKINEMKPRVRQRRSESVFEGLNKKNIKNYNKECIARKEATQPSAIYTPPKSIGDKCDFDVDDVFTLKDGKFVLVKLEGKNKVGYLKLKPKKNSLSINELKFSLNGVSSFLESLDCVSDDFLILEKEIVMKKLRKYESEEVEDIENELDIDVDEDSEDVDELVDETDVEEDVDDVEEDVEDEELEETPDSIPFSTEINGVRYSGTLYRDDSEGSEEVEEETEEVEDDFVDDEEQYDDDLILQSDEEIDELDFPEGLDESVIKANASIYGNKYSVSFCDVKKECVRKAKLEMRKHNIMEAWNVLVRGAKSIKC